MKLHYCGIDFYHCAKVAVAKKCGKTGLKDPELIYDVVSSLWESYERYLDKHNLQGKELDGAALLGLRKTLAMRASGAIIDAIRFRTSAKRTGDGGTGLFTPDLVRYNRDEDFSDLVSDDIGPNCQDLDTRLCLQQLFDRAENPHILELYASGHDMKSIGKAYGLSLGRISQLIKADIEVIREAL